jgi:hypothetical protein
MPLTFCNCQKSRPALHKLVHTSGYNRIKNLHAKVLLWRHDTQHNDARKNDTRLNSSVFEECHNCAIILSTVMLCVVMLSIIKNVEYSDAEYHQYY